MHDLLQFIMVDDLIILFDLLLISTTKIIYYFLCITSGAILVQKSYGLEKFKKKS
jgi:hypothetical protein